MSGPTRRDVLGFGGMALGTLASGGFLLRGAVGTDAASGRVSEWTVRTGREWDGTPVTLSVGEGRVADVDGRVGYDTRWTPLGVAPRGGERERRIWLRQGTCMEVEATVGRYAAIEGILTASGVTPASDAFSRSRRVRVQLPTGGTGPPARAGDPESGPSSVRTHDPEPPPAAEGGGLLAPFRRIDVSDRLSFGVILHELLGRFEGTIPAVAGRGVLDGSLVESEPVDGVPRKPVPLDEDLACTAAAQD